MVANKLIKEKSPYLLQHAENPVDWFPWSEEAFDRARKEDKPVFLSIGYSTCRWCHNMARESFEDDEIASILNENFVSIKVDREELPQVDRVYMSVCEGLTGQGGWPLSVFVTPEKIPFFAGTYFPKVSSGGRIGFKELLQRITGMWKSQRNEIIDRGEEIVRKLSSHLDKVKDGKLDNSLAENGFSELKRNFEKDYGGVGKAPKFPLPSVLFFMLRYGIVKYKESNMDTYNEALKMLNTTLKGMYKGGLFDHVGGGFYRYSVDEKWLVPHFEKMLYDNAELAIAYLECFRWSNEKLYKVVAQKTLDFMERELLGSEGAFYTAIDAESEGEEGKFYLWDYEEVLDILGSERGKEFSDVYGVSFGGNFQGENILNRLTDKKQDEVSIIEKYQRDLNQLFKVREKRARPLTDYKILPSVNSLAIVSFLKAGRILQRDKYIKIADNALDFILKNLRRKDGRVLARYSKGEVAYLGNIEDYAYLAWALIEYYNSTLKDEYLDLAEELVLQAEDLFKDKGEKAFRKYGSDDIQLFSRPVEVLDGMVPSGNSVMLYVMVKLQNLREVNSVFWEEKIKDLGEGCAGSVKELHIYAAFFLMGIMSFLNPPPKIKIYTSASLESGRENTFNSFFNKYNKLAHPDSLILLSDEGVNDLSYSLPFAELCEGYSCKGKFDDPEELEKNLVYSLRSR